MMPQTIADSKDAQRAFWKNWNDSKSANHIFMQIGEDDYDYDRHQDHAPCDKHDFLQR